jgi:hypothetical protein
VSTRQGPGTATSPGPNQAAATTTKQADGTPRLSAVQGTPRSRASELAEVERWRKEQGRREDFISGVADRVAAYLRKTSNRTNGHGQYAGPGTGKVAIRLMCFLDDLDLDDETPRNRNTGTDEMKVSIRHGDPDQDGSIVRITTVWLAVGTYVDSVRPDADESPDSAA